MKRVGILLGVIFVLFASVGAGTAYYLYQSYISSRPSAEAKEVIYEVTPGRSFLAIAADLEQAGVISNKKYFNIYARLSKKRSQIKRGEYLFRTNMTPVEVMDVLISGRSIERSFTISEGLNIFEIALQLEKLGLGSQLDFLNLVRDKEFIRSLLGEEQESLEGYLFPETYKYNRFSTLKSVVAGMVQRFLAVYQEVSAGQTLPYGWTRHQFLTFASIVEKETGAPEERFLVSSVFHNRIRKGMRLQTDPTILYGKALLTGVYEIKISRADIQTDTGYNTYVTKGLPPGPISNPGKEALNAALNPANTNFLFFVSRNDGTHVFSETYAQHREAVQAYQVNAKAREGKSWRDLQKKKR